MKKTIFKTLAAIAALALAASCAVPAPEYKTITVDAPFLKNVTVGEVTKFVKNVVNAENVKEESLHYELKGAVEGIAPESSTTGDE